MTLIAPKTLSPESRGWWRKLTKEYGIDDAGGLLVLRTALEALDRMRDAQAQVREGGAMLEDRWGQKKPHPLLTVERDSRAQMLMALKQLNLDLEPLRDRAGRPSGGGRP